MRKTAILSLAAAVLLTVTAPPAAADDLMTLRMTAEQTAFSVDALAKGDIVTRGALYIDNYSGLSQMRVILKSDAPLKIENGDFTRDFSQTGPDGNPKIAFFADYSLAAYTQYNAETGRENLALWYGEETGLGDGQYYASGTVDQADSSYLSFDIRIPQGTAAGDYTCYISTDTRTIAGTLTDSDFFAYRLGQKLVPDTDLLLMPVRLAVYRRGDLNCDEVIGAEDAQWALNIYVATALAGRTCTDADIAELIGTAHGTAARYAADASEDGKIQVDDAQGILNYYVASLGGKSPKWDDFFASKS